MIPRTLFTSEHESFREEFVKFLKAEAIPHHERWEKEGQVERSFWLKAGEMGFLCPTVPEEYGGLGVDLLYSVIINEELSRYGLSGVGFGLHSDIVAPYILHYATEEAKKEYLPKLISGEWVGAIGMTEPCAGSDLAAIKSSAVKEGDHYVLNGQKTFITNGQLADLAIIAAKTDPKAGAKGTSLFLVECASEGFSKGSNFAKLGMKAQDTSELFYEAVKVPARNLMGEEGKGFAYMMQELPQERLVVGIAAVAAAEAALVQTKNYVQERKAFGQRVMDFQNTRFKLAEVAAQITQMRVFLDRCVELHMQKKLDVATAAMLKMSSTDMQFNVMDECLQLHGGYGYMLEYPISKAWADARVQRIYAGTNEIMKEIVARALDKM